MYSAVMGWMVSLTTIFRTSAEAVTADKQTTVKKTMASRDGFMTRTPMICTPWRAPTEPYYDPFGAVPMSAWSPHVSSSRVDLIPQSHSSEPVQACLPSSASARVHPGNSVLPVSAGRRVHKSDTTRPIGSSREFDYGTRSEKIRGRKATRATRSIPRG